VSLDATGAESANGGRHSLAASVCGLEGPIEWIGDAFEADMHAYAMLVEAQVVRRVPADWPRQLRVAMRRAEVARARDALARLRTSTSLPCVLPPDTLYLARLWLTQGLARDDLSDAHAICDDLFWERYSEISEEILADAQTCWEVLKYARAQLRGYTRRVLRLARIAGTELDELSHMETDAAARARLVTRVLAGETVPAGLLRYNLAQHHVAIVASPGSVAALRELARRGACQLLHIQGPEGTTWAWLGSPKAISPDDLVHLATPFADDTLRLVIADDSPGHAGFCASHRQAIEAWGLAPLGRDRITTYRELGLMAVLLRDRDFVAAFLDRELGSMAGNAAHQVDLRSVAETYLEHGQNAVATASTLGCSRRTVERKIARIELSVGHVLSAREPALPARARAACASNCDERVAPKRTSTSSRAAAACSGRCSLSRVSALWFRDQATHASRVGSPLSPYRSTTSS
jgi:hypothetical protein